MMLPQPKDYCYLFNVVCRTNNMIKRSTGYSYMYSMIVRVQLYHIGHCQNTMVVITILYWTKNNSIVLLWQL